MAVAGRWDSNRVEWLLSLDLQPLRTVVNQGNRYASANRAGFRQSNVWIVFIVHYNDSGVKKNPQQNVEGFSCVPRYSA